MKKTAFVVLSVWVGVASGQTPEKENATLQTLLAEVHLLRQDLEAVTIASQRVQIALYSLQMQDAALARATQRADEARNKCLESTAHRDRIAVEIQETERALASGTVPQNETNALRQQVAQQKKELEFQNTAVQACQAAESEASGQVRTSQVKLADLQDRIERLDKTLEKLGVAEK